ncbi:MAG: DUF5666 domain-containing protein, partial [Candidatus Binatia bacterium]
MTTRSIGLIVFFCLALSAGNAGAQLREGAHYEIAGVWSGGTLRATGIELPEDPVQADDADVEGRVAALDPNKKVLQIGPVAVQWSDSTNFVGTTPATLKIATYLEVEGRIVGPRRMLATSMERGPAAFEPNFLKILGPVTGIKKAADGSARFEAMGVPVWVPADVYREFLGSRSDAQEEEDEETPTVAGLKIEGEYEVKVDYQKDFALAKEVKDDLLRL